MPINLKNRLKLVIFALTLLVTSSFAIGLNIKKTKKKSDVKRVVVDEKLNSIASKPESDLGLNSLLMSTHGQPVFGKPNHWVDSVYDALTPEMRIGQLFMVAAYSSGKDRNDSLVAQLARNQHVGGLIFFKGTPYEQAVLTNFYQTQAQVPLLIGMDAEWGLGMRLDSIMKWPNQMTIGATYDDNLMYKMGEEMARNCKRLGVHISFSPVVDINNNPANPIINFRSFGQDRVLVADKSYQYMMGLQNNGILACAKHFPGHGDTDADSHFSLPVVKSSRERIDSLELYPFKKLIGAGLGSVMVAHLYVPAYDSTPNRASSLSPLIVNDLLKGDLKFKGLAFTDALNMKGVSKYFKPGELEVLALEAGNDVLLFPEDVPTGVASIKAALETERLTWKMLEPRIKKILTVKYWTGLNQFTPIETSNLYADLNSNEGLFLNNKIYQKAITLLKNNNRILPFDSLNRSTLCITLGSPSDNEFSKMVSYYQKADFVQIEKKPDSTFLKDVFYQALNTDEVILAVHLESQKSTKNFGIDAKAMEMLQTLMLAKDITVVNFGNPYALKNFNRASALVCAYEDNAKAHQAAAMALYGAIGFEGELPVTVSENFITGQGIKMHGINRFKITQPENENIASAWFKPIDSIVKDAISKGAMPGCQIAIMQNGNLIYNKAFGYTSYANTDPVTNQTIYDLASVTKVASTANALMILQSEGKFNPDTTLGYYLPELLTSDKGKLYIREVMTHQAGLSPFIPFWQKTTDEDGNLSSNYYCNTAQDFMQSQVAENLFLDTLYRDTIFSTIVNSPLGARGKYVYSDLGYYFLQRIVERISGMPINVFLNEKLINPMSLNTTMYTPLKRFGSLKIAPTEDDKAFRKQVIRGHVHDPGAAMMGGVAGHAGLFSNAIDLAKIGQMWLNKGTYDGKRYISENVIKQYTSKRFQTSRRGLCFDKPEMEKGDSPTSKSASSMTFGHTGFTGTCIWVDPQSKLVYVFLSNRVYPDANNKKLVNMNVRTNIQEVIYNAVIKSVQLNAQKNAASAIVTESIR